MEELAFREVVKCILGIKKMYLNCLECEHFDGCVKIKPGLRVLHDRCVPSEDPIPWDKKGEDE